MIETVRLQIWLYVFAIIWVFIAILDNTENKML